MKKGLLLWVIIMMSAGLHAQKLTTSNTTGGGLLRETHVSVNEAQEVGLRFLNAHSGQKGASELQMATAYRTAQGDTAFYVFNTANGFVMVAADRCATPILGYSDEGPFNANNVPVQMQDYMQGFVEQIAYGISNPLAVDATAAQQWEQVRSTGLLSSNHANTAMENNLANTAMTNSLMSRSVMMAKDSSGKMVRKEVSLSDLMNGTAENNHIVIPTLPQSKGNPAKSDGVGPLITAMWDQGCYYNAACPTDEGGDCGHVPTGCVATAMGMIMHYWGYPTQGTGTHSYSPDDYPTQTVDFSATTYDWNNMPGQLTGSSSQAEIDAVSTLLWHCGVAVDMWYSPGSSAALDGSIPAAFHDYFNYCNGAYYLYKENNSDWLAQVKASLDRQQPLMYFATDENGAGGHAFVCDGYDASDNLHFNWGWNGNGNGYFAVDALNVDVFQFNNEVHALFGIVPQSDFQLHYNIIDGGAEVTYEQPELGAPAYSSYPDTIVIPSHVMIEGVDYPVVAIGDKALQCCWELKSVTMPNTITRIGNYAFYSDYMITNIGIPSNLTVIGDCAFMSLGISTLDFPNTLTTIGSQAFDFMFSLQSLTIPQSVTSVGEGLAGWCDTVYWNADSCVLTHLPGQILWPMENTKVIYLGEHVRHLPDNIFIGADITEIVIPQSMVEVGYCAFAQCQDLTTVYFNAINCPTALYAFENCFNLKTINFGNSVRIVPEQICCLVPNIETVNFGNSVETIETYAFHECTHITSIAFPSSIKHIGQGAFLGCSGLVNVDLTSVTTPPTLGFREGWYYDPWLNPFGNNAKGRTFVIPCESYNAYYNTAGWCYYDTNGTMVYDYRRDFKSVPETEIQFSAIPYDTNQGNIVLYKNASFCDSTVIYFANAKHGYQFDHWSNGSTNNPDTLLLTSDITIMAYYAKEQFLVSGLGAASILFSNFEQPGKDSLWLFRNGDFVNRWYINDLDSTRAMFISNDGGQTNSYVNENAYSYVLAYCPLQLDTGNYLLSFDWRADGVSVEGGSGMNAAFSDCLSAFYIPGSVDSIPWGMDFGGYDFWNYQFMGFAISYFDMFGQHEWTRLTQNINIQSEGIYNLLFYWRNGRGLYWLPYPDANPNGFPAAIDNVVLYQLDSTRGYVTGAATVDYLDTVTLTAVPNYGYHFVGWYDGDTNITKQVVATDNLTVAALFDYNQYQVTVNAEDATMGTVSGGGTYNYLSECTITATPAEGLNFIRWSDGIKENPRTITVTQDTELTAIFASCSNTSTVESVSANESYTWGDSLYTTSGIYEHTWTTAEGCDSTVSLWLTITKTQYDTTYIDVHDTTYIDVHDTTFIEVPFPVHDTTYVDIHDTTYIDIHDTTYIDVPYPVHDTTYVDVHDTTYIDIHDTTYIDVPYPVHDTTYIDVHDTTYVDVPYPVHDTTFVTLTDTIVVTLYDTAYLIVHDTITVTEPLTWYTLQVLSGDMDKGVAAGSGQFPEGTDVEVAAIPIEGNRFLQWSDGSEANPRTITVTGDLTLTAQFSATGVESHLQPSWFVYPEQGAFVVKGAGSHQVSVYDAAGKLLHRYTDAPDILRYNVPASGSYLIQVDNGAARKVPVVR